MIKRKTARGLLMAMVMLFVGAGVGAATLTSQELCNRCEGAALLGRTMPHRETRWGIISDLPESFGSHGVLYSTREVLPANGGAPELLRQQSAGGFETIDGGFDVFLFHLCKVTTMSSRLVVHVRNRGEAPVVIRPRQVIKTEGTIGRVHEFENDLAMRVLTGQWDVVTSAVTVGVGEGRVIGYGRQFGNVDNGPDSSRNVNCFGYVRALVEGKDPYLEVSVVAIPAGAVEMVEEETAKWLDTGARSTDEVGMDRSPQGCALGRAVGVYGNFTWQNVPVEIDIASLDEAGTTFPMALPDVQTQGCAEARQTTDLVRHPGYTRPETIGNYMVEYQVRLSLTNSGEKERAAAVVFGKTGADIGLAYQVTMGDVAGKAVLATDSATTASASWAGPNQASMEKPFSGAEKIIVPPGAKQVVTLRFMVCGNSSLPFTLGVKPTQ